MECTCGYRLSGPESMSAKPVCPRCGKELNVGETRVRAASLFSDAIAALESVVGDEPDQQKSDQQSSREAPGEPQPPAATPREDQSPHAPPAVSEEGGSDLTLSDVPQEQLHFRPEEPPQQPENVKESPAPPPKQETSAEEPDQPAAEPAQDADAGPSQDAAATDDSALAFTGGDNTLDDLPSMKPATPPQQPPTQSPAEAPAAPEAPADEPLDGTLDDLPAAVAPRAPARPSSKPAEEPSGSVSASLNLGDVAQKRSAEADARSTDEQPPDHKEAAPAQDQSRAESPAPSSGPHVSPTPVEPHQQTPSPVPLVAEARREAASEVAEADGESGDAREPLEIESFERLDDKVKFRCECGKRITAPARAQRKTGKCPRCGRRLLLPAVETKRKPRTVIGGKPPAPKAPASPRPDKPEQAGTSKPEPGKESAETTCPHCDAVAPAGNRFCGACGKPLQEEPEPAPRAAAPRPEKRVLPAGVRPTNDAASAVAERLRRHRAPATLRPASCFIRILAGLVDVSLIVGAVALLYLQVPEPWYLAAAAGVVVALLNEVVMVVLTSRTLGKSIFGLRLVDRRGDSMGLAGALVRLLVKYPLAFLAWWMFILPDRRTIHDLAAGRSLVVRD